MCILIDNFQCFIGKITIDWMSIIYISWYLFPRNTPPPLAQSVLGLPWLTNKASAGQGRAAIDVIFSRTYWPSPKLDHRKSPPLVFELRTSAETAVRFNAPAAVHSAKALIQCNIGKRVIGWMSILYIIGYIYPRNTQRQDSEYIIFNRFHTCRPKVMLPTPSCQENF